jgi:hypothetical protein
MKKTFLKIFFFTWQLLILPLLFAQQINEKRIEFELKNGYENEKIFISSLGFFVMESTSEKEEPGVFEIKYDLFNCELELIKTEMVSIPAGMRFAKAFSNDSLIVNIYKNRKGQFLINRIRVNDLSITSTKGTIPPKMYFQDMKVLGNTAWFYAFIKRESFIYRINLSNGKGMVVPFNTGSYHPKKILMENFQLLDKSNELLVYINKKVRKNESITNIMRIRENGTLEKSIKLNEKNKNSISSISGFRISENKMIYTGTYSKRMGLSEGIFFCETFDDQVNYIKFYNFLDLTDFLSYLPKKKQDKIEKKKNKKEAQGKEFVINYFIASHDIKELTDGYLFLGEAYYPTYRTEMYTTYQTVNGVSKPVTSYRDVFDGYQYTHAILAKYSLEGTMLWDVCFEMYPGEKPHSVKKYISFSELSENRLGMVFSSKGNIISKIVDLQGNVLSDKKWELIDTGKETEKAKWTVSNTEYWYGNNFLIFGIQKIKDKEAKSKRKVYFVNKINH